MSSGSHSRPRCGAIVLLLVAGLVMSLAAGSGAAVPSPVKSAKKCKAAKSKGKKRGESRRRCRTHQLPPVPNVAAPAAPKVTLTVGSTLPGAGTIDSSPTGLSCGTVCSAQFDPGTVVTLTTSQAQGYFQTEWYGGGCSGHGVCQVVLNSDTAVVAGYVPRVTVTADAGTGGSVEGSAPGAPFGVCTGASCQVNPGDDVTLTASPDSGFMFDQWTGDCSGTDPVFTFTSLDSPDKACQASFAPLPYFLVTVNLTADSLGSGSVSSSPAGLNCSANCSASFQQGTVLTLTDTPDAGSLPAFWSGPCTGFLDCTFTVNGPTTVTAYFIGGDDPGGPPT
jgi:hypothetical protein